MYRFFGLSLTFMALLLIISSCRKTESASDGRVVVAYVTSWSDCKVDPTRMTHINYAFGGVSDTFNSVVVDNDTRLLYVAGLKKANPKLKVCLSIGGWGRGNFSEMAASKTLRESFAADCKRVVDKYSLDGIDIDWEYPTSSAGGISSSPSDTENFTLLMRDLRSALGEDAVLTLASVSDARYVDFRDILPYVDFVNIMSYDMGLPPLHNSPLFRADSFGNTSPIVGRSADEAVKYHLEAGVPKEKIVLGMPLYGHGDGLRYPRDIAYRDIGGPKNGDVEVWDDIAKVPYYADSKGVLLLGFENVRSIQEKCSYIMDNGLLGAMYWEYSHDYQNGSLTTTISRMVLGGQQRFLFILNLF